MVLRTVYLGMREAEYLETNLHARAESIRIEDYKTGEEFEIRVIMGLELTVIPDESWNLLVWKGVGSPEKVNGEFEMDGRTPDLAVVGEAKVGLFVQRLDPESQDNLRQGWVAHVSDREAQAVAKRFHIV